MTSDIEVDGVDRKRCPVCGGETEFVQFGGADSSVTVTTPDEVSDGLLELRWCDCGAGVENVLVADEQRSIHPEDEQ